jgi:F-type H+-transporting ATPase subunit delta
VRALVTSAKPLSPLVENRIKSALEARTGKTVLVEKREDPSLIAGVVAQIGDLVFDGSVRTQLANVRQQLLSE